MFTALGGKEYPKIPDRVINAIFQRLFTEENVEEKLHDDVDENIHEKDDDEVEDEDYHLNDEEIQSNIEHFHALQEKLQAADRERKRQLLAIKQTILKSHDQETNSKVTTLPMNTGNISSVHGNKTIRDNSNTTNDNHHYDHTNNDNSNGKKSTHEVDGTSSLHKTIKSTDSTTIHTNNNSSDNSVKNNNNNNNNDNSSNTKDSDAVKSIKDNGNNTIDTTPVQSSSPDIKRDTIIQKNEMEFPPITSTTNTLSTTTITATATTTTATAAATYNIKRYESDHNPIIMSYSPQGLHAGIQTISDVYLQKLLDSITLPDENHEESHQDTDTNMNGSQHLLNQENSQNGRLGELFAQKILEEVYSGHQNTSDTKSTITWMNERQEQRLPFDFLVQVESPEQNLIVYIEVKTRISPQYSSSSSRYDSYQWFISKEELEFAFTLPNSEGSNISGGSDKSTRKEVKKYASLLIYLTRGSDAKIQCKKVFFIEDLLSTASKRENGMKEVQFIIQVHPK